MTNPIKVNFSNEEASSAPRVVPPSGEYVVNITDGELREVKPGKKNTGKPYWFLKYVVQDGAYAGNQFISSIMLFDGALYSLSQIMKALGYDINSGDFEVPSLDEIIGKTLIIRGTKLPESIDPQTGQKLQERFEIRSYKAAAAGANKPSAASSLLP